MYTSNKSFLNFSIVLLPTYCKGKLPKAYVKIVKYTEYNMFIK